MKFNKIYNIEHTHKNLYEFIAEVIKEKIVPACDNAGIDSSGYYCVRLEYGYNPKEMDTTNILVDYESFSENFVFDWDIDEGQKYIKILCIMSVDALMEYYYSGRDL